MAQATYHFPKNFLWGTATSSHQVEGNNTNNNWWAWEQENGRIRGGAKSGLACDWWGGRWREDLDRAAEGGQNAHRLSIEWSRVQPAPDRWDEEAIDRYIDILRGLKERNISPLVTLHHFTDPLWLAEMGGWENEKVVSCFADYTGKVVDAFREYVKSWTTINEPVHLFLFGYLTGGWPPGKKSLSSAVRVIENIVRAHAASYRIIHRLQPQALVGVAHTYRPFLPHTAWSLLDRIAVPVYSSIYNEFFPRALSIGVLRFPGWTRRIPEAKATQDYVGINYYTHEIVTGNPAKLNEMAEAPTFPPGSDLSEHDYIANYPQGMFQALKWALKFNLPILITENGVEDSADHIRPRYLIQHLHQVWRAVNFNYPVQGYFHWSQVDNFEWDRGWTQRFGLWELNPETQARRKRPSADLYAEICLENGISSEMVARYAPEVFEKLFPN